MKIRNLNDPFTEDILTDDFENVQVLLTSLAGGKAKWTNTSLKGTLNLVKITYDDVKANDSIKIPPVVFIRMTDRRGATLFEYEIPLNLIFDVKLSPVLIALKIFKGNWLGLHFKTESDKMTFCEDVAYLRTLITFDEQSLMELKVYARKCQEDEFER